MPIIKFKKPHIALNQEYYGVIQRVEINKERGNFRIFVEIEEQPNETYLKSIRYSENIQGELARFLDELQVMNRRNEVNCDQLVGQEVVVTFNKGRDGNFYINEMWLAEEESEEYDNDEFDSDEDIDFDED